MGNKVRKGIGASRGIAIGEAFFMTKKELNLDKNRTPSVEDELIHLQNVIIKASSELDNLYKKTKSEVGTQEAMVFESHKMMLDDPEYIGLIKKYIEEEYDQTGYAIKKATDFFAKIFESMDNEYMRERGADIKDVGERMMRISLGADMDLACLPDNAIVIARDLTPSDTAQLDKKKVKAFITEVGSKTSHSAIMARSMGIPAVVGAENICKEVKDGNQIIVNGSTGEIYIQPNVSLLEQYEGKIKAYHKEMEALNQYRDVHLEYVSGRKVVVAGNMGSVEDLEALLKYGAEGIGLFRTEFLFMGRAEMPSEEEQFEVYKQVAEKMKDQPVIIRTLDIGGDKVIPYMNMPKEDNPFLGLRGLRLCFDEIDVFKTQLRAILRASCYGNLHIMFPMIGAMKELNEAKSILETCKEELVEGGASFNKHIPVGMMIEVPAAAICAKDFAKEVDFFSIGTNDLVQYTLAVDRMNSNVAELYDAFHPAVLGLIQTTIEAAHEAGIWCGMCGEMASDIEALDVLAQFELDEFSVTGNSILKSKERLSLQKNIRRI